MHTPHAAYQPILDMTSGIVGLYEALPQHSGDIATLEHVLAILARHRNAVISARISMDAFIGGSKNILPLLDDYLGATSRLVIRLAGSLGPNSEGAVESAWPTIEDVRQYDVRIAADSQVHGYFNPASLHLLKPEYVCVGRTGGGAVRLAKDAADLVGGEVIIDWPGSMTSLSEIRACGIRYVRLARTDCRACAIFHCLEMGECVGVALGETPTEPLTGVAHAW